MGKRRGATKKEKKRAAHWSKRVCVTKPGYNFIKKIQKEKNYKSMAGTLDYILNEHKKKVSETSNKKQNVRK